MKKGMLTKKKLKEIAEAMLGLGQREKIVGFIGGIPVISNPDCPPDTIYMLNQNEFNKLASSKIKVKSPLQEKVK